MDYTKDIADLTKTLAQLTGTLKDAGAKAEQFLAKETKEITVLGMKSTAIIQQGGSVHIVFDKGNSSLANEVIRRVSDAD